MHTVYAAEGLAALVRYLADQMTTSARDSRALEKTAIQRAVLCGAAGRLGEAFEALDLSLAAHEPALVHLAVAPQWDSLREDKRWAAQTRFGFDPMSTGTRLTKVLNATRVDYDRKP